MTSPARTLLLVDDEEALLHALQRLFHPAGYRLLSAGSGTEALRLLDEHDVQVILSDHRMPGMSGIELLARARAAHPDCVRMVLSGYADIEAITEAINHGHVYKFLHKPWDNEQLLSNVRDAFARHAEARRALLFSSIYRNAGEAIAIFDRHGTIEEVNPAFAALYGAPAEELAGQPAAALAAGAEIDAEQHAILAALRRAGRWRGETWAPRRDGTSVPIALDLAALRDERGQITGHVALCTDISERKAREIALRESEKRFRDIMEFAPIGMVIVDLDGRLLKVNQSLCDILGYPREELEGMSFEQITHPDDLAQDLGSRRQLLAGRLPVIRAEKRYLHRDGHVVWVQLTAALLRDTHGVPQCFDAQVEDITERKRDRERIRQLAYYDALTGLPNRRLFKERLDQALLQALRQERTVAVMFLDLDHFKQINDTHGHDVGDALLKIIADRLAACVRGGDTVARQGGDEFVVVLAEISQPDDAARVAEKLAAGVAQPLAIGALTLAPTASIGIALYPTHGRDATTLMRHADAALYAVKAAGRNGWRIHAPATVPPEPTLSTSAPTGRS
jgi:diguanylate cyclase (GGDEF)-like protein/PAS domain S-box-containing protein